MSTRCVDIEPEPTFPPMQHIKTRIVAKVVPRSLRMLSIIPLFTNIQETLRIIGVQKESDPKGV